MSSLASGFGSLNVADDELAPSTTIFSPISREMSYKSGKTISIYPLSNSEGGPYTFNFPEMPGHYINFPTMRFYVEGKVVQENGTDIPTNAKISCCNMLPSSLFDSFKTTINGKPIPELCTDLINYKTLMETFLSFNETAKKSILVPSMFEKDTEEQYNSYSANAGHVSRSQIIKNSQKFEGYTFLCSNFMSCEKLFPSSHKLAITIHKAKDSFVLFKDKTEQKNFKILINEVKLYVRYVEVSSSIVERHRKLFLTKPQIFPMTRGEIKKFNTGSGDTTINLHNLYSGKLPKCVLISMLETRDFAGDISRNPYNFQHFDLNYASLSVNGQQVPQDPYTPDMSKGLCARLYRDMFDQLANNHDSHLVSHTLFKGGHFIIPFVFSSDQTFLHHITPNKEGTISLELRFAKALTNPVTILSYAVYDSILIVPPNKEANCYDI